MSDKAPAALTGTLYCERPVALRERGRIDQALATENEKEMRIRAPAHVRSAHVQLFAAEAQLAVHS